MLKSLLATTLLAGSFATLASTPAQAHHYPVLDCSAVSGNVYAVAACKDRNRAAEKQANEQFRRQIQSNPQICNYTPDLKHYGVFAVAACKDANARYRGQQQRALSEGISNGSVDLPYKYIPGGGGGYSNPAPQYYPQPQSGCDLVIQGQCYRRRY